MTWLIDLPGLHQLSVMQPNLAPKLRITLLEVDRRRPEAMTEHRLG
jgi:hypothetical protein